VTKDKMFYCLECDEETHRVGAFKNHRRRLLVLGAGVRKVMRRRGDAVTYPRPLDYVHVRIRASIYHNNQLLYKEKKASYLKFFAGLSGHCVHIQVLGAKGLAAANSNGTSDPFVMAVYSGKKLGYTRVRYKTCNPRWVNETFIVPVGEHLQDPANTPKSQRGLFRLEVYNNTLVGSHQFLGHVEIDRDRLQRIARAANQQPILVPVTTKEFHGHFMPQLGVDSTMLTVKAVAGEALDMPNPLSGCYPYVKVFFGEGSGYGRGIYLGKSSVARNTVDPEWAEGTNEFRIKINEVLRCERRLLLLRKQIEDRMAEDLKALMGSRSTKKSSTGANDGESASRRHTISASSGTAERTLEDIQMDNDPKKFVIFRFELYDHNLLAPAILGVTTINIDELRALCPFLPRSLVIDRTPTRQDQIDDTYRMMLNPPPGLGPWPALCCRKAEEAQVELLEGEEDDDFWIKNIDEYEDRPEGTMGDSQSLVSGTTTLRTADDFELEERSRLSAKNLEAAALARSARLKAGGVDDVSLSQSLSTSLAGGGSNLLLPLEDSVSLLGPGSPDQRASASEAQPAPRHRNSLCTRLFAFLCCRRLGGDEDEDEEPEDPVRWGRVKRFPVEMHSTKNTVQTKGDDRGQLVLRLIASQRGNVVMGLDEGVRQMSLGEESDLKVRFDQAYGNFCQGGNLPARANVVFRAELLTINGWGKIYMPMRVVRRTFRAVTWTCKMMAKYMMRAVRDARRERRCAKFCARFCQRTKKDDEGELDDLVDKEGEDYSDSSSDDEGGDGPSGGGRAAVKLSSRMKKLVTPSAVHGANYLLGFKPQPVVLKKKKPRKKGKKGLGDLDAIDEEGDDGPGSPDGEGKEEMPDEEEEDVEGEEQQWGGDGEEPRDALGEGDERRLDLSALGVSAASASDAEPQASQRSQRSARPLPPSLTAEQAAALPTPEEMDLLSSRPPGSGRSGGSGGSGGSGRVGAQASEPVVPRPSIPPPQA
jgi:hypothetical protein